MKRLYTELQDAERIMSNRQLFPLEDEERQEFTRMLGEILHAKQCGINPRKQPIQISL